MNLYLLINMVSGFIEREGRISVRTLREGLAIESGRFEALLLELIQTRPVRATDNGVLEWVGTTSTYPAKPPTVLTDDEPAAPAAGTEAQRRQLTVMFCDLADSTALSAELDPEDLRDVISAFQDRCRAAVERFDGFIARYMGDGVLVYFGYPRAHEDAAARAIRAGLHLLGAMTDLNRDAAKRGHAPLNLRIGTATGPVVVGDIIGEGAAEEAAVVGETPNVAARLQAVAGLGEMVVNPLTRDLAGPAFTYEDTGTHKLKGIPDPVPVWRVRSETASVEVASSAPSLSLVGRQEELGLLLRGFESCRNGNGRVALLQGEAGLGKTKLVGALRAATQDETLAWATIRCSPYHTNTPYHPLIQHLAQLFGWEDDDDDTVRLAAMEAVLRREGQPLEHTVPLLADLMSVTVPETSYPALDLFPDKLRQDTQDAMLAWLLEGAERHPMVLVWEDLHWADASTLDLLGALIAQCPATALYLVLTYRPDFVPPWPNRGHVTPIALNRLDHLEVRTLVTNVAGKTLPDDVVHHITEKADGVPLYIEELTGALLNEPHLVELEDRYELSAPLGSFEIPETLQDLLMARLDRRPGSQEVAQLGAVLGREFTYIVLESLAEMPAERLQEGLEQLVDNEALRQRGRPPQARYSFTHALVHDAAYHSLLKRTRERYHAKAGRLLTERFPEVARANPALLARHFSEAGSPSEAIPYWRAAGEQAMHRAASKEAVGHLTRALEFLGDDAPAVEQFELQLALGHALKLDLGFGNEKTGIAFAGCLRHTVVRLRAYGASQLFPGSRRLEHLPGNWRRASYIGRRT